MSPKLLSLSGIAIVGGAGLLAGAQAWVSFMLDGTHDIEKVTGHALNPALSPVAIAIVAAALALTIAGPIFRRVLGVLVALLGVGLAALTINVLQAPLSAVSGRITELTGIAGGASTTMVVWSQVSVWAWVSLAAGVLAALLGVLVAITGGRWVTGGRKYDAGSAAKSRGGAPDRISDWDALSDGDDPTADIR
ncbi:Trp biosynthesis-associated membrane protein [Leucobacter chromiireducens]|uniref:Trp biosynthesis-associated membrane protein n=1 Tax=Leucobacter chromiireducens subsp. chromiireducens TaxID=660067 RepID=A0ABS1SRH3_9MICO|nr:Trp biosynthesis-associated membrane protein [Leucobacter chromiireducens]MBL3690735.1 hypothetical protein [Leucobacter chromiireducens subsp. chromiireducens]